MAGMGIDGFEDEGFNFNSFFSYDNPPKMLCFGDYGKECDLKMAESSIKTAEKSGVTCSDSSSTSSTNYISQTNTLPKSKKRNGPGCDKSDLISGVNTEAPAGTQKYCKKTKSENSSVVSGHAKVKQEKLGERITALQQLVSPFGKTDTASVLHEAMGYIRFLQDQVQVLCSPYIHSLPVDKEIKETRNDLRSKGLCLVPVELTLHVADSNGADFWSSAMMMDGSTELNQCEEASERTKKCKTWQDIRHWDRNAITCSDCKPDNNFSIIQIFCALRSQCIGP